jgi:hypothetical protein
MEDSFLQDYQSDLPPSIVECPRHEDCLFGKGEPIMKHPGNIAMRQLLLERWERYEKAAFRDKKGIAWEVVEKIKRGTGRFLREDPDGGYWFVEVEDDVARQKVSNAIRDMVQRKRQRLEHEAKQQQGQKPPQPASVSSETNAFLFVPKKRRLLDDPDNSLCMTLLCGGSRNKKKSNDEGD